MNGVVFDIKRFTLHDGPGIRTTVFLKSCPLRCLWCHNPESQGPVIVNEKRNIGLLLPAFGGRKMDVNEIMEIVIADRDFYAESGGGVSFSGGEPLAQPYFLENLLKASKANGLHTVVDTSGYAPACDLEKIASHTDLFLFDLKLASDESHLKYCGVSNKTILENLYLLDRIKKAYWLRFPVIPGITDTPENLTGIKQIMDSLTPVCKQIHLLPYHAIAAHKYEKLDRINPLHGLKSLEKHDLASLKSQMEQWGWKVVLGG
mgnify:CR=1 FL=1